MDQQTTIIEKLKARTTAMKSGEVAELLGISVTLINGLVRKGAIPHFRVAGNARFDPAVLAKWIKATEIDLKTALTR